MCGISNIQLGLLKLNGARVVSYIHDEEYRKIIEASHMRTACGKGIYNNVYNPKALSQGLKSVKRFYLKLSERWAKGVCGALGGFGGGFSPKKILKIGALWWLLEPSGESTLNKMFTFFYICLLNFCIFLIL